MPLGDPEPSKPKRTLIVTCSGGGGLLQAATAKEQEILMADPHAFIVRKDLLKDWVGKIFGNFCVYLWNSAQKKGDVRKQQALLSGQGLADYVFFPFVFLRALKVLFQKKIDRVIDTQPIATLAILKAIRLYNWKTGKKILLEKIVVDLPTKKATHFFRPIRKMSDQDRKFVRLFTIYPLLEEGQTREEFWKENCNLSESEISYEDPYIRQAFRAYRGKPRPQKRVELLILYKTEEEQKAIERVYRKGPIQAKIFPGKLTFAVEPQDVVLTILLGSQPAAEATLAYVKRFVEFASSVDKRVYLFLFSSEKTLAKISAYIENLKQYPKNFSIIPFSFQPAETLAPLFHRSNLTLTRSGGQTAMELMSVSTGEMWIHSEAKVSPKEATLSALLKGIPQWESESALYLQKLKGAKIVTPETIQPWVGKILESDTRLEEVDQRTGSTA